MLLPLVFLGAPNRRALLRLSAGFALGLLPFLPPALTASSAMYRNMVAYNAFADNWGIMGLLNRFAAVPALTHAVRSFGDWYIRMGRYVILLSVAGVALLSRFQRKLPMVEQAALGAALFLILAPRFGVQYAIYAAPLLCFVDLRQGMMWGWTSGLFIGAVYWVFLDSAMPLSSTFEGWFPFPASAFGLLAWAVLIQFAWRRLHTPREFRLKAEV